NYQDASPSSPLHRHGLAIGPADQFEYDALHDRLPTVSWIIPTSPQCEHPAYTPAAGADFVARTLDAVAANQDVWAKTVVIVNYDENDGLFDHVPPPMPPRGTADEFVGDLPIGAGIRVPCIIVSPWTAGGWVCGEPFDHTSVLRFLERLTGVYETNISAWRRQTFGDLTSALGFSAGRPFPALPATKPGLWQTEYDVAHLPPAPIPGAGQSPPHQEPYRPPRDRGRAAVSLPPPSSAVLDGSRPRPVSRLKETTTSHRADFPAGTAGTQFPGILAAAAGKAVPRTGGRVYVPGIVNYTVSVIDRAAAKLLSGIHGGANPYGIAATPNGRKLYVTNSGASDVSVIDPSSNTVSGTVAVGLFPHGIAVAPDGRLAYVANTGPDTGAGGSRTVSVITTATDTVTDTITVGLAPRSVAVTPDNASVYVTCADGLWTYDIRTNQVRAARRDQKRSGGVSVSPDGATVYVVNSWRDTVSVLDTTTNELVAAIAVGRTPWQVAFRPDGAFAYVTNANSDTVSVIDTRSHGVTATVLVGHIPTAITATVDEIWITNNASSTVTAISTATLDVVGTVELGLSAVPSGVVVL
ncbi:MAG: beta-propeller fold lactonase family protein, partial [Kutzneria sp.]|nr:beta-propeller fold lactonase family protein [Kutzneria sp.]